MKDNAFFSLIVGVILVFAFGAAVLSSSESASKSPIYNFKVKEKEILYSSDNDDRFYRVTAEDGTLFEIRDSLFTGVRYAGGIYARFTPGCIASVKATSPGFFSKYPQIINFIGQKCPKGKF